MLRGLACFEPKSRWSVQRAMRSQMLEPLREAAAEGKLPALCFTAYA